jgi:hypothetical protein
MDVIMVDVKQQQDREKDEVLSVNESHANKRTKFELTSDKHF